VVTGIEPKTSGLLDQRRIRSDNQAPSGIIENKKSQNLFFATSQYFHYTTYIPRVKVKILGIYAFSLVRGT